MHFEVDQRIAGSPSEVSAACADPSYYASLGELAKLGTPEVVSHDVAGGLVTLQIRYRFTGELSSAVTAVIDPRRLTWIERSTHDLTAMQVTFELLPDHYPDRLQCQGTYCFEPFHGATVRRARGELKVRAFLVGGAVENAIVSGLREHLDAESVHIERFLDGRRA
ncbi:MAG: DUF2505 family protein [Acidimicrobiales bacterium]